MKKFSAEATGADGSTFCFKIEIEEASLSGRLDWTRGPSKLEDLSLDQGDLYGWDSERNYPLKIAAGSNFIQVWFSRGGTEFYLVDENSAEDLKTFLKDLDLPPRFLKHQCDSHKLLAQAAVGANSFDNLKERLDAHEEWLRSSGADGVQFLARNEDFTGFLFEHRDLSQATFVDCNLSYCSLRDCTFESTRLVRIRMYRTLAIQSRFLNTQFVECHIESTNFAFSKFERAGFTGIPSLVGRNNFSSTEIRETIFTNVNFFQSQLEQSTLDGVRFNACDLTGQDFTKTSLRSSLLWDHSIGIGAVFSGMLIEGSRFSRCNLAQAQFDRALLDGSSFDGSDLTLANFIDAACARSNFLDTKAIDTQFYGANLSESSMRLSSFRGANFSRADIHKSDLSGTDLTGATIDQTTNRNLTNFSGCTWIDGSRCRAGSVGVCYPVNP